MKISTLWRVTLLLLLPIAAQAQQEPQYTQYMFNQLLYNPGYAGSRDGICAGVTRRDQWGGFSDPRFTQAKSPTTTGFNIHAPIKLGRNRLGLGLNIIQDEEGFFTQTGFGANVAYRQSLRFGELGFGVNIGGRQTAVDGEFQARDPNDPIVLGLSKKQTSSFAVDAGLGIWLNSPKYFAGLSVLHVNTPTMSFTAGDYKRVPVYFLTGGVNLRPEFLGPNFQIQPSFLIKRDVGRTQYDLNALALFKDRFVGGLTYRYQDAGAILAGMYVTPKLYIGYSYDLTTNELQLRRTGGAHEIQLRYCFSIEVPPNSRFPPRDTRHLGS